MRPSETNLQLWKGVIQSNAPGLGVESTSKKDHHERMERQVCMSEITKYRN